MRSAPGKTGQQKHGYKDFREHEHLLVIKKSNALQNGIPSLAPLIYCGIERFSVTSLAPVADLD